METQTSVVLRWAADISCAAGAGRECHARRATVGRGGERDDVSIWALLSLENFQKGGISLKELRRVLVLWKQPKGFIKQ